MTQPKTIIFFGIQGSGKGTQARLLEEYLSEKTGTPTLYLETGQLLRNFAGQSGYTNGIVGNVMKEGGLLPSFMPVYVLGKEMIERFSGAEHLIFDGAARRENQTKMIDSMLKLYDRAPYDVVVLDVPEDIAIERMLGRGRSDDTKESIQKRISWTKEHEANIIRMFSEFDCNIHTIDASQSVEAIQNDIRSALNLV